MDICGKCIGVNKMIDFQEFRNKYRGKIKADPLPVKYKEGDCCIFGALLKDDIFKQRVWEVNIDGYLLAFPGNVEVEVILHLESNRSLKRKELLERVNEILTLNDNERFDAAFVSLELLLKELGIVT